LSYTYFLGGQNCINNPDIDRNRDKIIDDGRQVIVPKFSFDCNGRITGVEASMASGSVNVFTTRHLPWFQIWRPSTSNLSIYTIINQTEFPNANFFSGILPGSHFYNLSLTNSDRIEFHSGDVVGYYQQAVPILRVNSIQKDDYLSYSISAENPTDTINISNADNDTAQPLIKVIYGM